VNPGGVSKGKGAFAVPAINKASFLQVSQGEPDGDATNIETAAELVLTGDGKVAWLRITENFLSKSGDEMGSGS
jgi:hypothetical protein